MLALYGHPFSSYTWKVLIALYANRTEFDFRMVDPEYPEHLAMVEAGGPLGKFPVLQDGDNLIFESTSIIEYLSLHHAGTHPLLPEDADAALAARMLDRVFDNYVMNVMQVVVDEHLRCPDQPDADRIAEARERLRRSYRWIEQWLEYYPAGQAITLVECSAAPALFYADWIEPITDEWPRLSHWRAMLVALPAVARCVDDARPYRHYFPPGAPDRD